MRFSCFVIPDLFSLTTYALTLCVSIFGSIMTVCKQPVAILALNATSIYVVMIREWGRDRLFKSSNYLYFLQMYGEEMFMKVYENVCKVCAVYACDSYVCLYRLWWRFWQQC